MGCGHDFPLLAILRHGDRLLSIEIGEPLVMIQMLFIPFGDLPEDAIHIAALLRHNRGDAIPAAVHAKGKAVSFQADGIHHFRIGAAEGHLV